MKESKFDGWFADLISDCEIGCSQYFNSRPIDSNSISLLVIHNISLPPEQFGGTDIEKFFQGRLDHSSHPFYQEIRQLKVSSHFLIKRDGASIQFVSTEDRAWHAGKSEFLGCDECNDFSIGIELEGSDNQPFTSKQYQSVVTLTSMLMKFYPKLIQPRIVGHSDIAPTRKTDPGPYFDWRLFHRELNTVLFSATEN